MQKVIDALFSLKEATTSLSLRVLQPSASWSSLLMKWRTLQLTSSSIWCVSHLLWAMHYWSVTYWDPCKKGGIHILKSSEVLKWKKVFVVSSSMRIVESRDKGFVLDLKLFFTIMDCFSRRFPPRFFIVKLVCFIGFPGLSYLVLFNFLLCMILMFVCFNMVYS